MILRFLKSGKKWRACKPSDNSKIGVAISPYQMEKLRDLKGWALADG
jgi:hypothetical protein